MSKPDDTQVELDRMVAIFQDHAVSNGYPMNDEHKRGAEIHKQAVLDWHNKQVEEVLNRLDKSMPTDEQLTTKYGYHMPDKKHGYRLALHDIRETIEDERKKLDDHR